jgi:hypothetical protein
VVGQEEEVLPLGRTAVEEGGAGVEVKASPTPLRLQHTCFSQNQSAFIKGRNLHDNFLLVRQLARKINRRKEPGVLLKLDLARAFDSSLLGLSLRSAEENGFPG